MQIKKATEKC